MWNVEACMNEMQELVAIGEQELPVGYKIIALKFIAAAFRFHERLDLQEQKMIGRDAEEKKKVFRDMALNMSRNPHQGAWKAKGKGKGYWKGGY